MMVLDQFLAGGTQVRIEFPGKSGVVMPVDTVEPPVVKTVAGTPPNTVNKLEWNDSVCKLLITFHAPEIGTAEVYQLRDQLRILMHHMQLASLELKESRDGRFDYVCQSKDGRTWSQQIVFSASPTDFEMTFNVATNWSQAECHEHHAMRGVIAQLVVKFQLASLEVTFA